MARNISHSIFAINGEPMNNFDLLQQFNHAPDEARVGVQTVQMLYGNVARCTIWRNVKSGLIPPPKKLTPNRATWRVGDLREALKNA